MIERAFVALFARLDLMPAVSETNFDEKLAAVIDETIVDLFGSSVLQVLHKHLVDYCKVSPQELASRLDMLSEILEIAFGESAARTIERIIARNFFSRIGMQFVANEHYGLQDYLEEARSTLSKCHK